MKAAALLASIAVLVSFSPGAEAESAVELESTKDRVSYSAGAWMGKFFEAGKDLIDMELLVQGLQDALEGKEMAMSEQEIATTFGGFQQSMRKRQETSLKADGKTFLAENAKRDDVVVLPSGLQYRVIKEGTGATPTTSSKVETHYRGTFIDGREFDSSYKRGKPTTFGVTQVIRGWTEALLLMKEGSKWEIFVPYDLAYGPKGRTGIPPFSTLIFEMELVSIQ